MISILLQILRRLDSILRAALRLEAGQLRIDARLDRLERVQAQIEGLFISVQADTAETHVLVIKLRGAVEQQGAVLDEIKKAVVTPKPGVAVRQFIRFGEPAVKK